MSGWLLVVLLAPTTTLWTLTAAPKRSAGCDRVVWETTADAVARSGEES